MVNGQLSTSKEECTGKFYDGTLGPLEHEVFSVRLQDSALFIIFSTPPIPLPFHGRLDGIVAPIVIANLGRLFEYRIDLGSKFALTAALYPMAQGCLFRWAQYCDYLQ